MLDAVHPRHQAQRGRAGPHPACCPRCPTPWAAAVRRAGASATTAHRGAGWPDRNDRVPALPDAASAPGRSTPSRLVAFMAKADQGGQGPHVVDRSRRRPTTTRVAGVRRRRSWPTTASSTDLERFLAEHRIVERGRVNSLAQTALLLTCPGVPDIYQGTELWDLSLVDPDNRRPVDYDARRRLLAELDRRRRPERAGPRRRRRAEALADPPAARPPPPAARRLRRGVRRTSRCRSTGAKAEHVVAFARPAALVVVVPRLVVGLAGDWARHHGRSCRRATGATCSPATPASGGGAGRRTCCAAFPGRRAGRGAGLMPAFSRLGARRRAPSTWSLGRRRAWPMAAAGGGWWAAAAGGRRRAAAYGFVARRRPGPARPALGVAARRRRRPVGGRRPRRLRAGPTAAGAGVALPGAVLYELHVGTFTAEGTFDGAIEHLDAPGRPRRRRRRADAGGRVLRRPRLGLRRRRPVRAAPRATAGRTG